MKPTLGIHAISSTEGPSLRVKKFSSGIDYLSSAEVYDPEDDSFSTTGDMADLRIYHTSTLLNNGKVLVAAGSDLSGDLSSAEIYNPASGTFTSTGDMTYARNYHAAGLLPNGKVLVAGGYGVSAYLSSAELYDPSAGSFSSTGNMISRRGRYSLTLLPTGKTLVAGGFNGITISLAELYNPAGEMMLSHDFGMAGDQRHPKIVDDSGDPIVVWQDNRSFVGNTVTSDKNVFMQKFDGTDGDPQWPAADTAVGYSSPYAVMDIRVDTLAEGTGSHYSGKPAVGGVTGVLSDDTRRIFVSFEDNRNVSGASSGDCGYSNSSELVRVCGQSFDLNEYDINQSTNWIVYFYAGTPGGIPNITINTDIVEWDGVQVAEASTGLTWSSCSPSCPAMQSVTFTSGGSPAPPSDTTGNISMRRLRVRFTWNAGMLVISYDNTGVDSRLGTGTIVPENVILLGIVIPGLPPTIRYLFGRRRKRERGG